jgi:hypothetical protein
VLLEHAAVDDQAVDVVALHALHPELDEAVVHIDGRARADLARKGLVADGEALLGRFDGLGGDDDLVSGGEVDGLVVLGEAGANLGSLGVDHDGHGDAQLVGDATDALDVVAVVLVGAVAEVEACNRHARTYHLAQDVIVLRCGAQGAYDFGPVL